MTIPVVWMDAHPLCWDQAVLDAVFANDLWPTGYQFEHHVDKPPTGTDGAVVVVPARYHTVDEVNDLIAPLRWALILLTSDEEGAFPWRELRQDQTRTWVQTPRTDRHQGLDRVLGVGWPPDTPIILKQFDGTKQADWFFSGQVNHTRRRDCFNQLRWLTGGEAIKTPGFTQGMERRDYLARTAAAKVIPCPSGPHTPDTFRLWEALEAGCVPLADSRSPAQESYWEMFGPVPFPVLTDWDELPTAMPYAVHDWDRLAVRCSVWWQRHKRDLARRISDDIYDLSGEARGNRDVTVLIPTSPIPSHPTTTIIEATVESVRRNLPDAELLIMCDGIRPEQRYRCRDYEKYLNRLVWLCEHHWGHALPIVFDDHRHQANMTRETLALVDTPLVLFVEHDTPFSDEPIDWGQVIAAMHSGELDMLRFHHEACVLAPHKHLMLDHVPHDIAGCPVMRTFQWSQRPHIARTDYYRSILEQHFPPNCKTMIEDKMHSVAQEGTAENRLAIYAPEGTMRRTLHLDGRGSDPKYEMDFGE